MTDRCEPPPELRDLDGWHWVEFPGGSAQCWEWDAEELGWWDPGGSMVRDVSNGWRYVAPVATPAEVEALRAERDDANAERNRTIEQYNQCHADYCTLRARVAELERALNTPELHDFGAGVVSEAQHQRQRWGSEHDAGKAPEDWFWLVGYLAGKALHAAKAGDTDKALHHTISTAAALANWHAALLGATDMRPGIGPGSASYEPARAALSPATEAAPE